MLDPSNERYRIVIVDDEPLILRSIRAAIPWDSLGIDIIGEARHGEEALRLIRSHTPHIVLSDIRMPSMDGIRLMKTVLQEFSDIVFIMVSGYGEFEYAREALRHGAFDYVLKPIDHEELQGIIHSALNKLELERKQKQEAEMLYHSVESLSLLARERLYTEWIGGNDPPHRHLIWLEQSELHHGYTLLLIRLDHLGELMEKWKDEDRRLWYFVIRNIVDEIGDKQDALAIFPLYNGEWVMLLRRTSKEYQKLIAEEIIASVHRCTHLSCSVGISREFIGLKQLNVSYQSAVRALYGRFLYGPGNVFFDEENDLVEIKNSYPIEKERSISEAIKELDGSKLEILLDEWSHEMEKGGYSKKTIERYTMELIVSLHRQFEHWQSTGTSFPLDELLENIERLDTFKDVMKDIKAGLGKWLSEIGRQPAKEDSRLAIEKAVKYIESNYHRDLGIDELAEYVYLSTSHFCSLFKQETEYTFLEYLTKCRIEKACFMLLNTDMKVFQIASMIGYQDAKYFTQVFKKLIGMTPSEYREQAEST